MARFKPVSYAQTSMVPIVLEKQLVLGTLEFAIHYLIETRIDISLFEAKIRNDETIRPAYNPKVIVKAVLLAYSRGDYWVKKDKTSLQRERNIYSHYRMEHP